MYCLWQLAWYALYGLLVKQLPISDTPIVGPGCEWLGSNAASQFMSRCDRNVNIERNAAIVRDLVIGDYSGVGINAIVGSCVTIGRYVMIGPDVCIYTRNHCFADTETPMYFQGYVPAKPVTIEDDVWIGARVIILPGVTISCGAIVGAGAVFTRDVAPYHIVGGNPARTLKVRLRHPQAAHAVVES